ncbi:hypothetical protein BW13_07745 [Bifidobacterium sp. UTCIF-37]|nr:hypothetical protein BW13_07745 [Bifidobacterium sp. UTCIF-37]TPF88181.1 hypothetical protein BW11_08040 [Bifidobacterium sp. UTCIF-38]
MQQTFRSMIFPFLGFSFEGFGALHESTIVSGCPLGQYLDIFSHILLRISQETRQLDRFDIALAAFRASMSHLSGICLSWCGFAWRGASGSLAFVR